MNMTDKLIEEKFKGLTSLINAQFESTHDRLDKINGSVAKHEKEIQEALIERAANRQAFTQFTKLTEDNCKELSQVKESLMEYKMVLRYPKLFVAGIILILLLSLASFFETTSKFFIQEKPKTEIPE